MNTQLLILVLSAIILLVTPSSTTESFCYNNNQMEEDNKCTTTQETVHTTGHDNTPSNTPQKNEPEDKQTLEQTPDKGKHKGKDDEDVTYSFPSNLKDFGYEFTSEGKLQSIDKGEPFQFEVRKNDKAYNQQHYDALGEIITPLIYELLMTQTHLTKHIIPVDVKHDEATSFFFASKDAFTNPHKLMVIIHGSGVVRAGQWARRLIINDCLDSGTQLPYIERAILEGYGVVVLNGNRNHEDDDPTKRLVRGSSTPEEHGVYVWKHFISTSLAKRIHIIAHSHGGVVTVEIMKEFLDDFTARVDKIAFTDSVHKLDTQHVNSRGKRYISNVAINWVSSKDPLDTPQGHQARNTVPRVSAGTNKHVETSWFAIKSVFKHLKSQ